MIRSVLRRRSARERPAARYFRERPGSHTRSGLTALVFHVPKSEAGRIATPMMVKEGGRLRAIVSDEAVPFPVTGGRILFDPERAFSSDAYPSGGAARPRHWSTTSALPGCC